VYPEVWEKFMAEDERRREAASDESKAEQDDLSKRLADLPPAPDVPEPPRLSHLLPPQTKQRQPGAIEPGSYNRLALATTAASSFVMPIIVLFLGGWWLDTKWHTTPWLAFTGVLVGLVVGVVSLLNITRRME
jgi:F0F1-type ATP synthase assembly protein I